MKCLPDIIALSGTSSASGMNSKYAKATITSSSSSSSLIPAYVDWDENKFVIGCCMKSWKVGETLGTEVGMIVEIAGGDEGGSSGAAIVAMVDVELPSQVVKWLFVY